MRVDGWCVGRTLKFGTAGDWMTVENYQELLRIGFDEASDTVMIGGVCSKCDTAWQMTSRRVAVAKGARGFRVGFDVRSDVDIDMQAGGGGYCPAILWYDVGGRLLARGSLPYSIGKSLSFVPAFATGKIPSGAVQASVKFGFDAPNLGPGQRVELKNLTLDFFDWPLKSGGNTRVGRDVRAPVVRVVSATPTTNANETLRLGIEDASGVDWSSVCVSVDGRDHTPDGKRMGSELVFPGAGKPWEAGLHEVNCAVSDTLGNRATNRVAFLIGETAAVPKATVRSDGAILVDGKPFFPIGIFGVCKREFNGMDYDRAFEDLKAAGFNLAHSYVDESDPELLAAAERHGFKLWVASAFPTADQVFRVRFNPCVLAWYTGDDTSMHHSPEEMRCRRESARAIDPGRLTCQADVVGGECSLTAPYADYIDCTDVIMPEIYPITGDLGDPSDTQCVSRVICNMNAFVRLAAESKDGPKSVWPILQYFKGWSNWRHFPTRAQLFATSFAAIIRGAKGMTWYTYGGFYNKQSNSSNEGITSTPERFRDMSDLCNLIRKLSPVLLSQEGREPEVKIVNGIATDYFGNPTVCALERRLGKTACVLAVNARAEPIRAEIGVGLGNGMVEVAQEGRKVAVSNGKFTDAFAPFQVHIYRYAFDN